MLAAVNGMTPVEFTNTGEVAPAVGQFEHNTANNTAVVAVLPKGMEISKTADTSALSSPVAAGDSTPTPSLHVIWVYWG